MDLLKTLVLTATLIISCNHIFAQKKNEAALVEKDWYIKESLPLSETQRLGIYEHKGWDNGIALINNKCAVEWELPFKGCVMAVSKYKGNYLVIYSKKGYWTKTYGSYNIIDQLNAAIIDSKTQKIIDDKVVYSGKNYVALDFQNAPNGNFSQLLVRETKKDDLGTTSALKLISFNADGNVATKAITSIATTGLFVGSSGGKDGSFFISSIQNGSSVVVEKFSHEGSFISKQESSPLNILKKSEYKALVLTDTCTNNAVFLTLLYVNQEKAKAFSHFRFNFDNNQVAACNEAPLNKISTYGNVDQAQFLQPMDAFFTKDNVIVVRTEKHTDDYSTPGHTDLRYWGAYVIVSVFDKQMKLQRDVLINKTIMSYNWRDPEITAHLNKDRLYIPAVEISRNGDKVNFCYNINLNDGTFEKKPIGSPNPSSTSMYAPASIWFGNEFILTHLHATVWGKSSSVLERVSFDAL
jgi:hypothetical protein